MQEEIKRVLTSMVTFLVDLPDDVKISIHEEGWIVICTISVDEEDKGKVIGKQGGTLKAISKILTAGCRRLGDKRVQVGLANNRNSSSNR